MCLRWLSDYFEIETNRNFQPNLMVRKEDQMFYLEVETCKNYKASHNQKWKHAIIGSERICMETSNMNTVRLVQGSTDHYSRSVVQNVLLYIPCLAALKA